MSLNISQTSESLDHGGEVGVFVIRVIGAGDKMSEKIKLSENSKLYEPGTTHTVVLAGEIVGKIVAVEITLEYQTSVLNPLTWRLLQKPKAYIESLTIDSLEFGEG